MNTFSRCFLYYVDQIKKKQIPPPLIKNKSNCLFRLNLNTKGTYIHTYIIYAEEKKNVMQGKATAN